MYNYRNLNLYKVEQIVTHVQLLGIIHGGRHVKCKLLHRTHVSTRLYINLSIFMHIQN